MSSLGACVAGGVSKQCGQVMAGPWATLVPHRGTGPGLEVHSDVARGFCRRTHARPTLRHRPGGPPRPCSSPRTSRERRGRSAMRNIRRAGPAPRPRTPPGVTARAPARAPPRAGARCLSIPLCGTDPRSAASCQDLVKGVRYVPDALSRLDKALPMSGALRSLSSTRSTVRTRAPKPRSRRTSHVRRYCRSCQAEDRPRRLHRRDRGAQEGGHHLQGPVPIPWREVTQLRGDARA